MRVDDALLTFCNEAYANAARRGASEVAIADLVRCIAGSSRWRREIELAGGTANQLLAAAEADIAAAAPHRSTDAPRTSDDLKALLTRAEAIADQLGRACASPGDLIHVLLVDSGDLASAAFVRGAHGTASARGVELRETDHDQTAHSGRADWSREGRAATRTAVDQAWRRNEASVTPGPAPTAVRRGVTHGATAQAQGASHGATVAVDSEARAVSERLAANEMHLAELQRLVGGLAEQMATLATRIERAMQRAPDADLRRIDAEVAKLSAFEIAQRREGVSLASRLEAHERHLTEFRRLIAALSHETETSAARLAQALDLGRAQATALARLEQTARWGAADSLVSGHRQAGARRRVSSSRSRSRLLRRRGLRIRLRQRRRDRLRLRLREDQRQSAWSRRVFPAPAVAPRAILPDAFAERVAATPAAFIETARRLAPPEPAADLDEEIAEPIEDEDDLEPVGAFGERPKRFYLALDDEVERAPSIGPRTAERLTAAGIATVRDLLACDPRDVASRIASRYVSVERVTAWKAQARLVCTIPWLRGTHAQLLVGAGFDSLASLVDADEASVCAGILRFAATREGQSVLRSGPPPAAERVAKWMEHVVLAEPERAKLAA